MIKAVLFDLDGTLLNTNKLISDSFTYTFKEILKKDISKEEITLLFGKPLENIFKQYTDDEDEINILINTYRKYNIGHHDSMCKPFDHVEELLSALRDKKIKIAIVTSKRKELATRGLELGGILDYIDLIISPEDTTRHKPEGEPVEKACELLGVNPKDAIMVGDSPYDLLSGKNAGSLTCGVEYTALNIEELHNVEPTYMVKEPLDILKLI